MIRPAPLSSRVTVTTRRLQAAKYTSARDRVRVYAHSKRDALLKKAAELRLHLSVARATGDFDAADDLQKALYETRDLIYRLGMDPLTFDVCQSEPWLQECKVFDL